MTADLRTLAARTLGILAALKYGLTKRELAARLSVEVPVVDSVLARMVAAHHVWATLRGSDQVWELTAAGAVAAEREMGT